MFKNVKTPPALPAMEKEILEFWKEKEIFEKSISCRKGAEEFIFFDGPPFATGLPHYGHLLAGTIKDVVPRYQTMRGKLVDRVFGWDCHGLPVEYEMEKTLEISGKKQIEDFGIGKFNEACRSIVLRYTEEWERVVTRMGRWVDFKRGYRTMDLNYMESIWWVFKQLWEKGLVYEGTRVLPYCPRCSTPLSNFEANQGYAEVTDPAITIRFQDSENPNIFYLAWTTTPWTLPSNLALAVGSEIRYVKVRDAENEYVLAESRLSTYYPDADSREILATMSGAELAGASYRPLFPYFANLAENGAFKIITAEHVTTEDGTGIVHTAPGFGEDDSAAGKANGVPEVCPVDAECKFTSEVSDYAGRYVKDTDKDIIRRLKEESALVHRGTLKHNYPHCWRDDAPLIYRSISTWFVDIAPIKEKMIAANKQINWVPPHIRDGRFGKWLENARDWSISRNRYWGNPLPIWRNETGETICVGSVKELEELTGTKITDIHKHFVDELKIPSPTGGEPLRRIPEVLDCWFESGSMPYAQNHYPFENRDEFESNFPADFIAEGLDQTRGWFYTLVVLGAALFDKPAFSNVVVNGLVLAEDGQKMSKRKKNYPDPVTIFDSLGADALRLFLLGSPVVRGENLKFSEDSVKEVLRSVLIPVWNAYSFFVTYANLDEWEPEGEPEPPSNPANPLDRWVLSSLSQMIEEITANMDTYNLQKAANRFEKFVDDLTNWYIRRSRRRFWKSQNDSDKKEAYTTLHFVLLRFCQTAAPFIPFITEEMYRNLRTAEMPESVHLCDFPTSKESSRDETLERQMELTMETVSLGRHLRAQRSLRVRQPLSRVLIVAADEADRGLLKGASEIIAEELNVKKIDVNEDDSELVTLSVKANFKSLGPKLGKLMKSAAAVIAKLDSGQIEALTHNGQVTLNLPDAGELTISPDDVILQREERPGMCVATNNYLTVALDANLTEELEREGVAREFVSRVQNIRKESAFEVSDRIDIFYTVADPLIQSSIEKFSDHIRNETLAIKILRNDDLTVDGNGVSEVEIKDSKMLVGIQKRR